ncbi:MAG: DUF86 domain-containing protein [Acidobacteria bacterium]|nr:DUF86 domain-containing protein [Acidobacteriota bacterium]
MTPGSVKRVVVADKVALIRRLLDGIATLPLDDLRDFQRDQRMVAAAESYLRRALEALLDIARHVLAKGFGRGAAEYAEVARQLGDVAVVSRDQAERLLLMARYRNRLVHVYDEVTETELYDILTRHLGDIPEVVDAITDWMAAHPDRVSDEE